jgi:hypothetical protein
LHDLKHEKVPSQDELHEHKELVEADVVFSGRPYPKVPETMNRQ